MQNRRVNVNTTKPIFPVYQTNDVHVNAVGCFSVCSLLLCVINSELTVLTAMLALRALNK